MVCRASVDAPRVHVLAQQCDLRLHLAPQLVVVQVTAAAALLFVVGATAGVLFGSVARDREEGGDEGFFEVREAEVLGDAGDGGAEFLGEFDGGFGAEFGAPVVAVQDALGFGGEREEVFAVEAAGTAGEAGVESI